jgi:hypothetical protein
MLFKYHHLEIIIILVPYICLKKYFLFQLLPQSLPFSTHMEMNEQNLPCLLMSINYLVK